MKSQDRCCLGGIFLPPTHRTYLDIEFVDFVKEILDALFASAPMQKYEFDVTSCEKGRNELVVYLGGCKENIK